MSQPISALSGGRIGARKDPATRKRPGSMPDPYTEGAEMADATPSTRCVLSPREVR